MRNVLRVDTIAEENRNQAIPLGTYTYGGTYDSEDDDDNDDDVRFTGVVHQDADEATAEATNVQTTTMAEHTDIPLATPHPPPPATPSALVTAARAQRSGAGVSLQSDLRWQSEVAGEAALQKQFREEVLRQLDLVVFAYMRPGSAAVQLLHSAVAR